MIHFAGYAFAPFYLEADSRQTPVPELWDRIRLLMKGSVALIHSGIHNGHSAIFFADFSNHSEGMLEKIYEAVDLLKAHSDQIRFHMCYMDHDTGMSLTFTSDCRE